MADRSRVDTRMPHRVSLNGFAKFVGARGSARLDCVRQNVAMYQGSFSATSYYKDFTDALVSGRRADTDELMLQRCVSKQSDDPRRRHYQELRHHWLAMSKLHLPILPIGRARWVSDGLNVSLTPELGLVRAAKPPLLIKLWLQKDEPGPDVIQAIHWLLSHEMSHLLPGGQAAVLDLRREKLYERGKRPFKRDYEELLKSEAGSMAMLWDKLSLSA